MVQHAQSTPPFSIHHPQLSVIARNRVEEGNAWGLATGGVDLWGEQASYVIDKHGHDHETPLTLAQFGDLLGLTPEQAPEFAITRWQVLRHQVLDSNADIRVRGAVADVVIDQPQLGGGPRGVVVSSEAMSGDTGFGTPRRVILHHHQVAVTEQSLSGDAAAVVQCLECACTVATFSEPGAAAPQAEAFPIAVQTSGVTSPD